MPIEKMKFSPENGFMDTVSYPNPENEEQTREQLMRSSVQLRNFINTLITQLESVNGASNIGAALNPNATGNTVMEQLLSIAALLSEHKGRSDNPHFVTKAQVGLGNADNTSDINKPISTAMQIALNGKEPAFTKNTAFNKGFGVSAAELRMNGTASVGSLDSVARIDHVHPTDTSRAPLNHTHSESEILNLTADLNSKAPLSSPNLTGVPTAPTATKGTNSKQIATTEFVQQSLGTGGYGDMMKAIYDPTGKNIDVFAYTDSAKTEAIHTAAEDASKKANAAQANAIAAIPSSLPANGGNSDTVDGYHASQLIRTDNIAAQSVNYANSAGNANALGGLVASAFYSSSNYPCVFGKYRGNNQPSQFINIGFTPKAVIVLPENGAIFAYETYRGGLAALNLPCMISNGTKIVEITTNGFNVYFNKSENIYSNYDYINYVYLVIR